MADTTELVEEMKALTDRLNNGEITCTFLVNTVREQTLAVAGQPQMHIEDSNTAKALEELARTAAKRYMDEGCPMESGVFIDALYLIGYNIAKGKFNAEFFRSIHLN